MRLLLDEMYPPAVAVLLRQQGDDAIAVKESAALRGLTDNELLGLAAADRRVLVTENIADFAVLGRAGEHVGIVFCHPRRFPRDLNSVTRLVAALAALDASPSIGLGDQQVAWWLERQPVLDCGSRP